MKRPGIYVWIHWIHAGFVFLLLLTGAVLYVPLLRTWFIEYRGFIRQGHAVLGTVYFLFVLLVIPFIIRYLQRHRKWTKTFHICLQWVLGLGWMASGVYLWINDTSYLGVRQASIFVHDVLSLFAVVWISGHIFLWVLQRKGKKQAFIRRLTAPFRRGERPNSEDERDRGILINRRDVLLLFAGSIAALVLGGLLRWHRPISERFLASFHSVKDRGYFRIYSVNSVNPVFDPKTWRLKVGGMVGNPMEFSFDELTQLKKVKYVHDFHCVTGWSVLGVEFEGIPFSEIVKLVKPTEQGKYVNMYSSDRYYWETYELSQLMQGNVILCYNLDGKPLIPDQGAPLRLFHPDMYGYKSIKWLERIEFTDTREQGYWEQKGYDLNGYLT